MSVSQRFSHQLCKTEVIIHPTGEMESLGGNEDCAGIRAQAPARLPGCQPQPFGPSRLQRWSPWASPKPMATTDPSSDASSVPWHRFLGPTLTSQGTI